MTQTQVNYATASIFGPFIIARREVPGRKYSEKRNEKKREKELFEIIDDYVEQA